jgi:hypothetical protein
MIKFSDEEVVYERPERPTGVSVLALIDGLFFGIFPIFMTVFGILRAPPEDLGMFEILFPVLLSVLIVSTAIGTFAGNDRARLVLVYLIVLHQSLAAFNAFVVLWLGGSAPEFVLQAVLRIINSLIWIGIHVWYFFKPSTLEFFRRPRARR